MDGNSSQVCPDVLLDRFGSGMANKLLRANGLMLLNAILMGVVVFLGVYAPRARRNPVLGFVLLGGSTLFLPVVSSVAATVGTGVYFTSSLYGGQIVAANCEPGMHLVLVLVWTAVVVTICINTSRVVATDAKEGRSVEPPAELLIKAVWVYYLIGITITTNGFLRTTNYIGELLKSEKIKQQLAYIFAPIMILPCYKMAQKIGMFYGAKRSILFGRNPRVIVGYMAQQLQESGNNSAQGNVGGTPKLVVKGEVYYKVVEQPHFCSLKERKPRPNNGEGTQKDKVLVTLDRVWDLPGDAFLKQEHKDLCVSFALFKLLRCRFAKYKVSEAGFSQAQPFFFSEYLRSKSNNAYERVFQVIADELSCINSYYNSVSLNSVVWTAQNFTFSLISLAYSLYMFVFISRALDNLRGYEQVFCFVWCPGPNTPKREDDFGTFVSFGSAYYDVVPIFLVLAVLVFSEVKDFVFYICSISTKVDLICSYVKHPSWHGSSAIRNCIGFLINRCRLKLVNRWGHEMSQCSILLPRPWWKTRPLLWRFFGFPEEKSVKVPSAVKKSIFETIQNEDLKIKHAGAVKHIWPPSPPVTVLDNKNALSTCRWISVADTILAWHIATNIFEMKSKEQPDSGTRKEEQSQSSDSDDKIVATRLSRYCAYLVACRPELLPDDGDWCKKLYRDVLKGADRVLRAAKGAGFQRVIELLKQEPDDNKVLKNGAMLAEELVKDHSHIDWKDLAVFWSEMVLYVAPSENLDGHAEAIARGGELVTLLWALLAHAGIVDRLVEAATETSTVAGDAPNTSAEEAPDTAGDHHV